ncbi:hypothetical protein [Streptomyces noursei]|uniref:Uncharacterized protein n=1 Tax=Streptomyces noursei TaxID=1971 RepID=A0A2N8PAJ1_STRNR|nr:hypothetical protein [Streptomyces noursei]PNE38020.1 hypothetical protein AOB60_28015 [Streptomyces noursei]
MPTGKKPLSRDGTSRVPTRRQFTVADGELPRQTTYDPRRDDVHIRAERIRTIQVTEELDVTSPNTALRTDPPPPRLER